jgi:hypothetical protein
MKLRKLCMENLLEMHMMNNSKIKKLHVFASLSIAVLNFYFFSRNKTKFFLCKIKHQLIIEVFFFFHDNSIRKQIKTNY